MEILTLPVGTYILPTLGVVGANLASESSASRRPGEHLARRVRHKMLTIGAE